MHPQATSPVLEDIPDIPRIQDNAVSQVKAQIAAHAYTVDAERVAEEIIRKLRFARWARQELAPQTGQTPQRPAA